MLAVDEANVIKPCSWRVFARDCAQGRLYHESYRRKSLITR